MDKKPRAKKADGGESIGSRLLKGINRLTGYESEADRQTRLLKDVGKSGGTDYGSPAMKGDRDKLDRMSSPYKKGGSVKKHSDEPEDRALVKKMVKKEALSGKSSGGRTARATGGRTGKNGKTTVNIVISGKGGQDGMMPPMPGPGLGALPPAPPMPMPPMPPMGAGPMGPGAPGPLPRKKGGRANADVPVKTPGRTSEGYPKMDYGAATGQGRRQKILAQRD